MVFLRGKREFETASGETVAVGGSLQHFFHYLLGFLLPAVAEVQQNNLKQVSIEDCGPSMNEVSQAVFHRMGVSYLFSGVQDHRSRTIWLDPSDIGITNSDKFRVSVEALRLLAFDQIDCCEELPKNVANLILQRAPMPQFYGPEGTAEVKGFGTSRRKIKNLHRVSRLLRLTGVSHEIYTPGQHTIWCQIRRFSEVKRILGIRGAEWANAAWSRPDVRLRIVYPDVGRTSLLADYLDFLELRYELVYVSDEFPNESVLAARRFFR